MNFLFLLLFSVLSIKPIYLVSGFGDSPIYSQIHDTSLYPECPSNVSRIIIKNEKSFNIHLLSYYPDCVAKLLRVQFNTSNGKVDQLPGIFTDSTLINDPSLFYDTFGDIITKINRLGYQNNINFFSVGYNHFLHPVSSYRIYDALKEKIEQAFSQTGEKSIIISYDQGASFISIFLSNYSQPEWAKRYIDSVIFIAPTFAGIPSLSNLISQNLHPFTSNDEFKKTIMRMPGLHMMLPNYVIYENYTIDTNYNTSRSIDFLKELQKIDDESEIIFKTEVEKFIKVPVPEPPIPSVIIYQDEPNPNGKTISINNSLAHSEGSRYACNHWRSTTCISISEIQNDFIKSNKVSEFLLKYISDNGSKIDHKKVNSINLKEVKTAVYTNATGKFNDECYLNSHLISPDDYKIEAPEGFINFPLTNAFDGHMTTYYVSNQNNSDSTTTTFIFNFSKRVNFEAFIFDPAFDDNTDYYDYEGIPQSTSIYTAIGDEPFTLNTNFTGEPKKQWIRFQFLLPEVVSCDRLKIEFTNITEQRLTDHLSPTINLVIKNLFLVQHYDFNPLCISASKHFYNSKEYLKNISINSVHLTITDPGMTNFPSTNAIDNDPTTFYIPSESSNNIIEIQFDEEVQLDAFLYDLSYEENELVQIFHGFPKILNVYTSSGTESYQLKAQFYGSSVYWWKRIQFVFGQTITCDKLKLEFVEVSVQTIEGNSKKPVIGGLLFIQPNSPLPIQTTTGNYTNEGYIGTHQINPSHFTYNGTESFDGCPLSYAFDGFSQTMYMSKKANDDTFNNEVTVNFKEKMIVSAILLDINYLDGSFMGSPKKIVISSSIGSDEFKFDASYEGEAVYPWTRLMFELPVPVVCDKIKFEYADVTENIRLIKSPMIGNMILFQELLSETVEFEKASGGYENDTFLQSIIIDPSDFTYNGPDGLPDHDLSLAFDGDAETYYISSEPNNRSFSNFISIKFSKTVILEAFLYDVHHDGSNFHGCPTGVFVFASLSSSDQTLVAAFFGSPVSPRIQFVFPSFVECDSLTIEFVTVTSQSIVGTSNSPVINGLHIIRAQIPATPAPTNSPSYSPSSSPSYSPSSSSSYSQSKSPSSSPSYSPSSSPSNSLSKSPSNSPSKSPSSSPSYSPWPSQSGISSPSISLSSSPSPVEVPIEDVCSPGSSCSFEGTVDNQILVTINKTDFSNQQNGANGGAIMLHNAGIIANNISFSSCHSESGGGGAIYVKNDNANISSVIKLENIYLTSCRAKYGGAIYLYSVSEDHPVVILNCHFMNNQADGSSDSSSYLSGGSAVFLATRSSIITECDFLRNIGENQLKIINHFTDSSSHSLLTLSSTGLLECERKTRPTNIIKYCRFEIDRRSKSSIFYLAGNKGSMCYLRNSVFVGSLNAGSYHIDGDAIIDITPKLIVEFCKFSTDYERSFNPVKSKDYLAAMAIKQEFNYNEVDEVDKKNIFLVIIVAIVVLFVFTVIVACEKKSESAEFEELL